MATNKVNLRTIQELIQDYVPIYQPLYPLFMSKAQSYPEQVGRIDFKRAVAIGDIRAKHVTPKDTEIKQIGVNEGTKSFKKYFLANQFVLSSLQDSFGVEDTVKQVLDEHHKQADDLFLLGEGTSASNMVNNGLFWSNDPNYDLENSAAVAAGSDSDNLRDMYAKIMISANVADQLSGRKLLIVYGDTAVAKYDSIFAVSDKPFSQVLQAGLGADYSVVKLKKAVTPSGTNGWIIANLDQVKLHYTVLPTLRDQGINSEKMYAWFNFMMGSCMLDVLAANAVIRQPVTFS